MGMLQWLWQRPGQHCQSGLQRQGKNAQRYYKKFSMG
jgi:hypothetical protein